MGSLSGSGSGVGSLSGSGVGSLSGSGVGSLGGGDGSLLRLYLEDELSGEVTLRDVSLTLVCIAGG